MQHADPRHLIGRRICLKTSTRTNGPLLYITLLCSPLTQLEIRRAIESDGGIYTCLASNKLGDAAVTADVLVRNTVCPGPPT